MSGGIQKVTTATAAEPELKTIHLDDIDWDDSHRHCQIRGKAERVIVDEYADAMRNKAEFPPVVAFTDGTTSWLVDGFHRCEAAFDIGRTSLPCLVHQGCLRDAILFAVGVNAAHGLRRTNDDKRRAVMTLLNDDSWSKWSDRKIANQCAVSNRFVSNLRASICEPFTDRSKTVERNGTIYEMKTDNIGKSSPQSTLIDPPEETGTERHRREMISVFRESGDSAEEAERLYNETDWDSEDESDSPEAEGSDVISFCRGLEHRIRSFLNDRPPYEHMQVADYIAELSQSIHNEA